MSMTASRRSGRATVTTVSPGRHDLADLGPDRGDHTVEVRARIRVAELLLRLRQVGAGAADVGGGGLARLLAGLEVGRR